MTVTKSNNMIRWHSCSETRRFRYANGLPTCMRGCDPVHRAIGGQRRTKIVGLRTSYFTAIPEPEAPDSVTFPARPFNVNGDTTNFPLLRAIDDPKAQNQVRELVIRAYSAARFSVAVNVFISRRWLSCT
jgi:hypothetical protein